MKIIFSSFQGINRKNELHGMTKVLMKIFEESKIDSEIYYIGYNHSGIQYRGIKTLGPIYNSLFLLSISYLKIFSLVFNRLPNYGPVRFFQEYFFDFFLKLKLDDKCILVSTAIAPKSFKKNSLKGGINLFIPGSPCERYISDLLKFESQKHNIDLRDVYTYVKRINFIEESLESVSELITLTKIVDDSYGNYFPNLKRSCCELHVEVDNYIVKKTPKKNDNILTFGYIAHTVWLKGLHYLLDAFDKISVDEARLIVAGVIDKQTHHFIEYDKLSKNIEFLGSVTNINDFYSNIDICIIPSIIDNHPTTITESLCSGTPVIATNQCGSSSLIKDYINGFVVDSLNVDSLRDKINWFISNRNYVSEMSANATNSYNSLLDNKQNQKFAYFLQKKIEEYQIWNSKNRFNRDFS